MHDPKKEKRWVIGRLQYELRLDGKTAAAIDGLDIDSLRRLLRAVRDLQYDALGGMRRSG